MFALVCFALALTDAGFTAAYATRGVDHWALAAMMANAGAVLSTVLNVHFVASYSGSQWLKRGVVPGYAVAFLFIVAIVSGNWWKPGTIRVVQIHQFGIEIRQVVADPSMVAAVGYALLILAGSVTLVQLFRAYRGGKREARGAVLGHAVIVACAANDVLSVAGITGMPVIMPYGFLIYGFGVADTLLVRYRRTADDLEATATELRQATEALTNSYLELSIVQEELFRKKQLASVGELAASIAHEVRNPLAIIANAAANLKRPSLGAADRTLVLGIVEEEIVRLNNLVTELLRFARPMNVRREEVSLAEVLNAIAEQLGEAHPLDIRVSNEPGAGTVWADANLLRLAMQNMVANAKQALPNGGAVVVSARRGHVGGEAGAVIEVSDEGSGMDSQTLRRAMDSFFSTRPSGTGLGLPIVGRIADAHGGRVEVTSRVGEGTAVVLFIPDKRPDSRAAEPVRSRLTAP